LMKHAMRPGEYQMNALELALQAMPVPRAHDWLRGFAAEPASRNMLIKGSGIVGDPIYVPWLIRNMADPNDARLAGQALSRITGADLSSLNLESHRPPDIADGPNDDPDDPDVASSLDDAIAWPDPELVAEWWNNNSVRYLEGVRYFAGAYVERDSCMRVLRSGSQPNRILAARYLCLLEPGTTLFEWRAPASRQQRLLDAIA
jgi:uncharacterized protein (TIGR02270 family)